MYLKEYIEIAQSRLDELKAIVDKDDAAGDYLVVHNNSYDDIMPIQCLPIRCLSSPVFGYHKDDFFISESFSGIYFCDEDHKSEYKKAVYLPNHHVNWRYSNQKLVKF